MINQPQSKVDDNSLDYELVRILIENGQTREAIEVIERIKSRKMEKKIKKQ
jgi:hypothetical protein